MRAIETHKVKGCNDAIRIGVLDEPGHGGACHRYVLYVPNDEFNEELNASLCCHVSFQNGPVAEAGVNGFTHEALLAVLIDRLEHFQAGPYACDENAVALMHVRAAMTALKNRTAARMARGVEGTHTV